MCLIAFAINASARWPLVIASNRDEFFNRPTLPLARWQTASGQPIISGRDLRAGGSWLGITPGGRVAFLTNVRGAQAQLMPNSRGELVTRWLDQNCDADMFAAALEKEGASYGGFNLVLGDFQRQAWTWLTNKSADHPSGWQVQSLPAGVYGLSNAGLDTPWPKTTELKRVLAAGLEAPGPDALRAALWAALANRQRAPVECLPATGVPLALEQALSSAFVDFPEYAYGTRCSTLLLASAQEGHAAAGGWDVRLEERTHGHQAASRQPVADAMASQARHYTLAWRQAASTA